MEIYVRTIGLNISLHFLYRILEMVQRACDRFQVPPCFLRASGLHHPKSKPLMGLAAQHLLTVMEAHQLVVMDPF